MAGEKAAPRLVRFEDLDFQPRFEQGEMAQLAEISGSKDGTTLGVGFARMTGARIDWTVQYDEVLIVLSGRLKVHVGASVHDLGPHDSLWLPAGTALTYDSEGAMIAYAIHPADWSERPSA